MSFIDWMLFIRPLGRLFKCKNDILFKYYILFDNPIFNIFQKFKLVIEFT